VRLPSGPASPLESELLERVRKLEQLAQAQKEYQSEIVTPHLNQGTSFGQQMLHRSTMSPGIDTPEATPPKIETLNGDIAYLESIYRDNEQLVNLPRFSSIGKGRHRPIAHY
jgi:hypothetical protein